MTSDFSPLNPLSFYGNTVQPWSVHIWKVAVGWWWCSFPQNSSQNLHGIFPVSRINGSGDTFNSANSTTIQLVGLHSRKRKRVKIRDDEKENKSPELKSSELPGLHTVHSCPHQKEGKKWVVGVKPANYNLQWTELHDPWGP